jgi:cystathionine beta-lyase/cystathionine gamma-synthase
MTHGSVSAQERTQLGITETFLRLSIGIEDAQDLIDDLEQAFNFVFGSCQYKV